MKVLIIGAGPAGCSCAIQLLKAGFCVDILDREHFPRHAPGETLHPGVEPLLQQLNVLDEVLENDILRTKGIVTEYNAKSVLEPYNEQKNWLGFQLFRKTFDQTLLDKAIALGANFYPACIILHIKSNQTGISEVASNQGNFKPNYVIDASGKTALFVRKLKISYKYNSPKLIAYYGYVKNEISGDVRFDHPRIIWDENGWTWIALVKKDLICWNRLSLLKERVPLSWLPHELANHKSIGTRKAVDVTWRIAKHMSKNNYFLVGDAAYVLDPASSHGVLKAIMSGIMAAFLINEIIKKRNVANIHQCYNTWMLNMYKHDIEVLNKLYISKKIIFSQHF